MTRDEAAGIVNALLALYPNAKITERTPGLYEAMLADLDAGAVQMAVVRLGRTSTFLPSVAEIRAAAIQVQHGPRRTGIEAWGDIEKAMRRCGSYGSPRFKDPLVAEYVRRQGWEALCQTSGNEASDRVQFARWYDARVERAETDLRAGHALPPASSYAELKPPQAPQQDVHKLLAGIGRAVPGGRR